MKKIAGNKRLKEFEGAYPRVLEWFFDFPDKEIGLSDLSENLEISKATANRVVNLLENEGFLKVTILGKIWRIKCNKNHIYNYSRKIPYHLIRIYESGILGEVHKKIPNSQAIILFGSYRKGDDISKSDIDIAVEIVGNEELRIEELGIVDIGFRKNIPVNLYIFSRSKIDINLFANIANGILLEGFLEVKP